MQNKKPSGLFICLQELCRTRRANSFNSESGRQGGSCHTASVVSPPAASYQHGGGLPSHRAPLRLLFSPRPPVTCCQEAFQGDFFFLSLFFFSLAAPLMHRRRTSRWGFYRLPTFHDGGRLLYSGGLPRRVPIRRHLKCSSHSATRVSDEGRGGEGEKKIYRPFFFFFFHHNSPHHF